MDISSCIFVSNQFKGKMFLFLTRWKFVAAMWQHIKLVRHTRLRIWAAKCQQLWGEAQIYGYCVQPLLSICQNKNAWYSLSTSPSNFRGQKLFQLWVGKETILLWINNWHLSGHVTMQILREWTILQEKTKIYIKKK